MDLLRRHLSYANVVASLALFLALGGAAFAATQLPRNSVGTGQLKREAVTAGKIAKRTRNQLRGAQGPQGKTGRTGAKGAKGATGARGPAGADGTNGTGPAFEVFATNKAIPGPIAAQTLAAGSYVLSADVTVTSAAPGVSTVSCTLAGSGEMQASVGENESAILSASITRNFGAATAVELTCSGPVGVTATAANMIATQVKSTARAPG